MDIQIFCEGYKLQLTDLNPDANKLTKSDALAQIFIDDNSQYQNCDAGKSFDPKKCLLLTGKKFDYYIGIIYPEIPSNKSIFFRVVYDFSKEEVTDKVELDTKMHGVVNFLFEMEDEQVNLYLFALSCFANVDAANKLFKEVMERVSNKLYEFGYKIETVSAFDPDDAKMNDLFEYAVIVTEEESRVVFSKKN